MITTNAGDVSDWWDNMEEALREDAEGFAEEAARRTHDRAVAEVPVDTGALRDSLTQAEGEVYSTLHYAPHVGLGTIFMEQQDYLWGPAKEEFIRLLKEMAD